VVRKTDEQWQQSAQLEGSWKALHVERRSTGAIEDNELSDNLQDKSEARKALVASSGIGEIDGGHHIEQVSETTASQETLSPFATRFRCTFVTKHGQ